ncbi:hypothetical protein BpHYR1_022845 [Brachionus plicatilis]|uniref:Uncharacterized protein n=1 Tax=Brachionus plicatilis TaxID=10195 RepID=A0A3M7Q109_BRAPC|nr:hypothetical protein BpHYR1_022845 [Brachionus plicatilis]
MLLHVPFTELISNFLQKIQSSHKTKLSFIIYNADLILGFLIIYQSLKLPISAWQSCSSSRYFSSLSTKNYTDILSMKIMIGILQLSFKKLDKNGKLNNYLTCHVKQKNSLGKIKLFQFE